MILLPKLCTPLERGHIEQYVVFQHSPRNILSEVVGMHFQSLCLSYLKFSGAMRFRSPTRTGLPNLYEYVWCGNSLAHSFSSNRGERPASQETMANVSDDLLWSLVRSNTSFLYKRNGRTKRFVVSGLLAIVLLSLDGSTFWGHRKGQGSSPYRTSCLWSVDTYIPRVLIERMWRRPWVPCTYPACGRLGRLAGTSVGLSPRPSGTRFVLYTKFDINIEAQFL